VKFVYVSIFLMLL